MTRRSTSTRSRPSASWTPPNAWWRRSTRSMNDFDLFKRLTRLYFAAASFSETARRLGRTRTGAGLSARAITRRLVPGSRAIAGPRDAWSDRSRAREPARARSTAPSSPSTSPGWATTRGATGIRCWPRTSSPGATSSARREREIDVLLERCGFTARALQIADCRLQIEDFADFSWMTIRPIARFARLLRLASRAGCNGCRGARPARPPCPTRPIARRSPPSTPAWRRCRPARTSSHASRSSASRRWCRTSRRAGPTSACCCCGSRRSSRRCRT